MKTYGDRRSDIRYVFLFFVFAGDEYKGNIRNRQINAFIGSNFGFLCLNVSCAVIIGTHFSVIKYFGKKECKNEENS